jgi:beta-galactosidase/beta-glucuronidase
MLKMIILPRQARDKHTQVGKTQKEMRFSQGVICTLYGPDGGVVGSETATHSSLPPQTPTTIKVAAIHVVKPRLWSIRTPVLYTLVTVVSAAGQQHNDTINTTLGFRDLQVRRTHNAFFGMRGYIIAFYVQKHDRLPRQALDKHQGGNATEILNTFDNVICVQWDYAEGLKTNGERTKIRGCACLHAVRF